MIDMQTFLLTVLVMLAFAANSFLNRLALVDGTTGPAAFAAIRLISGAVMLAILALPSLKGQIFAPGRWQGVGALVLYVLGFSFAYVTLETGIGALILFGGVQITMFVGALIAGEAITKQRWLGAAVAFTGLVVLCWPAGGAAPASVGVILMLAAALGWGMYSLLGRGVADPLGSSAANFVLAAPVGLIVLALLPDAISWRGVVLGCISGAVTSGLGYALWYSVLPRLKASTAAIAQLSVPVLAALAGIILLGEALSLRFVLATGLVLGGIALSLLRQQRR